MRPAILLDSQPIIIAPTVFINERGYAFRPPHRRTQTVPRQDKVCPLQCSPPPETDAGCTDENTAECLKSHPQEHRSDHTSSIVAPANHPFTCTPPDATTADTDQVDHLPAVVAPTHIAPATRAAHMDQADAKRPSHRILPFVERMTPSRYFSSQRSLSSASSLLFFKPENNPETVEILEAPKSTDEEQALLARKTR